MTYFKVIKNEEVIDVGCVFLKWDTKRNKMYICNPDEAQFVQSINEDNIYKASWLNSAPRKAGKYDTAEVVVIDETEYNDLNALLSEGEQVTVETPPPAPPVQPTEEEPEEKPMTIAEMRERILEQQRQIDSLMEMLQS